MSVHSMRGYVVLGADSWSQVLGALDPATAAQQIISAQTGLNASSKSAITASAQAGQMLDAHGGPAYIPGTADCAAAAGSSGPSNVQLAQVGSSLALTGINVAAALSPAISGAIGVALGPATMGISAIIGLFPMLFGHHAAAVKKEQSVLCAAVPAANNYLQIIDQAVQQGKATPQQAISALQSLVSDFQTQVASIMHSCNAACVMLDELKAIVLVKQSQYQDLAATQPAMSSGSGPVVAPPVTSGPTMQLSVAATPVQIQASAAGPSAAPAPGGITPASGASVSPAPTSTSPSWLPIAALLIGGFFLARVL